MGLALGGLPSVVVEGTALDRTASAAAVHNNLKTLGGSVAGAAFAAVLGTLVVGTTDTSALSAYLTVWGLGLGVSVLAAGAQLLARLGAGRRATGGHAREGRHCDQLTLTARVFVGIRPDQGAGACRSGPRRARHDPNERL
ncbi:hypothetical protein ACFVJK_31075 [Streptomyces sp. NPDC127172]|jgi:hypothetical protein|uniref:hypothetical protein n=1 Tax=Streptomyces sp. NPDC127172 TaxID=3345382 RepID=UPI00363AB99A